MKKAILSLGLFAFFVGSLQAELPSADAVATVNGQVITATELDRQTAEAVTALHTLFPGPEVQSRLHQLKLKVLDTLIERELMIQSYHKTMGQVPDPVINQRLDDIIRENYGDDRKAFEETLKARGITLKTYRDEIATIYIVGYLKAKNITDKIPANLSDEEARTVEAKRLRDLWSASLHKDADIKIYLQ